jgi:L-ascorbate metabolism protein UlaG (beta-lactamase superfamily)
VKTTVTILGHAGLFIEAGENRILVDPILRTAPLGSASVVHTYTRALDLEELPPPTLVVLTHGHLDHFDPVSLAMLARTVPVVVPHDPAMHSSLAQLGFSDLRPLAPWEAGTFGGVRLTATPSHAPIDEFGLFMDLFDVRFFHPADSEPTLNDARRIHGELGRPDLASVKFQPASPAHGVFRALGPHFDKHEVVEWLECAAEIAPRLAFPYASGVKYQGRHSWLNRYAFPFTTGEIAKLLESRFGRGHVVETVLPGDVFELSPSAVRKLPQASPFVRHVDDGGNEPRWEPFEASTLAGLSSEEEVTELEWSLEKFLREEIAPWIARRLRDEGSPIRRYVEYGVVYQLLVHLGPSRMLEYAIDYRAPRLTLTSERHADANYFAHLSGRGLLDVLRGIQGPEVFYMSGDARLYEKVLAVRDGAFFTPPVQGWELFEQLPEPVTHYLRHTRASC